MAILAKQQEAFKRAFKIHYTRRVRKTHNMQQQGTGFSEGDIVMILDLSASERQPPFPQLGVINKFMDPLNSQAVIHYGHKNGQYKVVNRPLSLISKLVSGAATIPKQGMLFDPWILEDLRNPLEERAPQDEQGFGDQESAQLQRGNEDFHQEQEESRRESVLTSAVESARGSTESADESAKGSTESADESARGSTDSAESANGGAKVSIDSASSVSELSSGQGATRDEIKDKRSQAAMPVKQEQEGTEEKESNHAFLAQ